MAFLTVTQAANYATAPIGTNATHKSSSSGGLIKAHNCNMRWFEDKYLGTRSPAAGLSSSIISDLKCKKKLCSSRNLQFRVCMTTAVKVDTEVKKIPVSPLSLEDATEPPKEKYTPDSPYEATVVSVTRIVGLKAPAETCHVVLDHDGNVPSWEGQNYGVIPPGSEPVAERLRYFSIASSRYGDYFDGKTSSLSVRRRSEGAVAANFLCDRKPGDKVLITGPYGNPNGTDMYLPNPVDPKATFIMVATGTGVAPFRAQLRRLFMEDIPNVQFKGLAWLFHGVATFDSRLYSEEFSNYRYAYPANFLYDWSLSREDQNLRGGKMYIQDKIEEHAQVILRYLDGGAIIYFSGLEGMMLGIEKALKRAAEKSGQDWDKKLAQYKSNNQWRVQVY